MTSRLIFFICVLVVILHAQVDMQPSDNVDQVQIFSISTDPDYEDKDHVSSYEGGTILYVKGTGFDAEMASNNKVLIGDLPCNIEGVNSVWLMCVTTPYPEDADLLMRIFVNTKTGVKQSVCKARDACKVYYRNWRTPTLYKIEPQSASPMQVVRFAGYFKTRASENIYQIKIGKFLCDREDMETFNMNDWDYIRFECRVAPETVGGYHAAVVHSIAGDAEKVPDYYVYRFSDGKKFDFVCAPSIYNISNNIGSIKGQILSINGMGFSENPSEVKVEAAGTPCKILNSSLTNILCEVQDSGKVPDPSNFSIAGGGFRRRMFSRNYPEDYCTFSNNKFRDALWDNKRLPPLLLDQPIHELQIPFENGQIDNIINVMNGFFKAPVAGKYRFFVSGDDYFELWISTIPNAKSKNDTKRVAFAFGYTDWQDYLKYPTQISDYIYLDQGSYYYIEAFNCEGGGASHMTVSVEIPKEIPENNGHNVEEVQEFQFNYEKVPEIFQVKIWGWNTGSYSLVTQVVDPNTREVKSRKVSATIGRDASQDEFRNALGNLGYDYMNLKRIKLDADGNELPDNANATLVSGYAYNAQFIYYQPSYPLPFIEIVTANKNPRTLIQQIQAQSPPIAGNFTLKIGDLKPLGPFEFDVGADRIKAALIKDAKIYFNRYTEVYRYGRPYDGLTFRIKFKNFIGNPPTIQPGYANLYGGKDGTKPNITVREVLAGSSNFFYEPTPQEFLFGDYSKTQVTIEVNGVRGSCATRNCDYLIQLDTVPVIESFSESKQGLLIKLSRYEKYELNSSTVTIDYGGYRCNIFNFRLPDIECGLTKNPDGSFKIEAGLPLRVHILGIGYALPKDDSINKVYKPEITTVEPKTGGQYGGLEMKIKGNFFPVSNLNNLSVNIGSAPCKVLATSNKEILVEVGAKVDSSNLKISYNGQDSQLYSEFSYSSQNLCGISSLKPSSSSPSLKRDIIIEGISFGNNKSEILVSLVNQDPTGFSYNLSVVSLNDSQITAVLSGGRTGNYNLIVSKKGVGKGYAVVTGSDTFKYEIIVDDISPNSGTYLGGTVLTIKGKNFSPSPNQNQVFIGKDNIMCLVKESSATEIKCVTQKATEESIDVDSELVVAQRIQDEATCSSVGKCLFRYYRSKSPNINIPKPSTVIQVLAGDEIYFEGENLDLSQKDTNIHGEVTFKDGTKVNLRVWNSSSISFIMPILEQGVYPISSVYIYNKGFANMTNTVELANQLKVISLSQNEFKRGGGILKITGNAFKSNLRVVFDDLAWAIIDSITPTEITVDVPQWGANGRAYRVTVVNEKNERFTCDTCTVKINATETPTVNINYNNGTLVQNALWVTLRFSGVGLAGTETEKPIVQLQLFNEKEASIINNITQIYNASKIDANATDIYADFEKIPAGIYRANIYYGSRLGFALFNNGKFVNLTLENPSVVKAFSSYLGGNTLNIKGTNFPTTDYWKGYWSTINSIFICERRCEVISAASNELLCQVPALVTEQSQKRLKIVKPGVIIPLEITSDSAVKTAGNVVVDGLISTYYETKTQASCFVTLKLASERYLTEIQKVRFFPRLNTPITTFKFLSLQTSLDGINFSGVLELDINFLRTGWNEWTPPTAIKARYFRISAKDPLKCQIAEIEVIGYTYLDANDDITKVPQICEAEIKFNSVRSVLNNAVEYNLDSTPTITAISPDKGTTAGGTVLTITGEKFGKIKEDVTVLIDDVICVIDSVASEKIVCRTGPRPLFSPKSLVVTIKGNRASNQNLEFTYIDLWSSSNTWGGETPPREGDSVYIPPGQNVLLDISTPVLNAVLIEGNLIFDDKDLTFDAYYVVVRGGSVKVGTWDKPYTKNAIITMHGTLWTRFLPEFGNKGFGTHKGTIDMHGIPRKPTWTLLAKTAEAGATSIELDESVDWTPGEEIVIASSSWNHNESETRIITGVSSNNKVLTLNFPLKYRHYSETEKYGNQDFPMKVEVGLLTRNILFRGIKEESKPEQHGAHMMFHREKSIGRISYTEFEWVGQGTIVGRYPIHFHRIGTCHECFAIGNAVHNSFARVTTLHGTDFLTVQKNVGYNVNGHNYFVEDGVEQNNLIEDNLGISTKQIWTLIKTDVTAATFWITNPNNIVRRNRAGGGDWYGFWYELLVDFRGPSYTTDICPDGIPLGIFDQNYAHSNGRFGFRIFRYIPRYYPCVNHENEQNEDRFADNPPVKAVFQNFYTWKNFDTGVRAFHIGMVEFRNIFVADSRVAGIDISTSDYTYEDGPMINGSLVVARSQGNAADISLHENSRGIITPRTDCLFVNNVQLYNFNGNNMSAFESCSKCWHPKLMISGGKITKFKNITIVNSTLYVKWIGLKKEVYIDMDGSMTGEIGGSLTPAYPHLIGVQECRLADDAWDTAVLCTNKTELRSVMFKNLNPYELFFGVDMRVLRLGANFDLNQSTNANFSIAKMAKIFVDTPDAWGWTFATGYQYNIHWLSGLDFMKMTMVPTPMYKPKDRPLLVRVNYTDYREEYEITVVKSTLKSTAMNKSLVPLNLSKNNFVTGDYFNDLEKKMLYMGFNGYNNGPINLVGIRCRVTCPQPTDDLTKENFVRLWSNISMWPDKKIPEDGQDVTIPGNWRVLLDVDSANLGYLHIDGDLIFDERRTTSKLVAEKIWVKKGSIIAGKKDKPFTNKIEIKIIGSRNTSYLLIDPNVEGGNKVLAVTGKLHLFGNPPKITWTKLAAIARKGQNYIELIDSVDWNVGDEIVIAPTGYETKEVEKRKITKIENQQRTVYFDTPLEYMHYGSRDVTRTSPYGVLDMRGAVGVLTRNIVITSDRMDSWGVRVLVYHYKDGNITRRGNAELHGVEISNGGQYDTWKASLDFQYVRDGEPSVLNRSSIHSGIGWCLSGESSVNLTVVDNVFYDCEKFTARILNSNYIKYLRNLMIKPRKRPYMDGKNGFYDMVAGLDMYIPQDSMIYDVRDNLVQGSEGCGFVMASPRCNEQTGFVNNTVGSSFVGFVAYKNNSGCTAITDFVGYRNDLGIISIFTATSVNMSKIVLAENRINYNVWLGQDGLDLHMHHSNMLVLALAIKDCPECYPDADDCSNRHGTYFSVNQVSGFSIPIKKPTPHALASVCKESPADSKTYVTNVTYENFMLDYSKSPVEAWRKCKNNRIYETWSVSPDSAADQIMTNVQCVDCHKDAYVLFTEENPAFIGWFGGCGDFQCTGKKNLHITDTDGKFLGKKGQIIPHNDGFENYTACTLNTVWNGYECNGYTLGKILFESVGEDALARLIAPVNISNLASNYKNTLNQWREWRWEGPEPLDLRRPRFNGLVELNKKANISMHGLFPMLMRFKLERPLAPTYFMVFKIRLHSPEIIEVLKNGKTVKPFSLDSKIDLLDRSNVCGANIYNHDELSIEFVVTGEEDCIVYLRKTNSVRVSLRMDVKVEDFYNNNGGADFVDKVAAFLKIDTSRIRIVNVRSGSTILEFAVVEKPKPINDSSTITPKGNDDFIPAKPEPRNETVDNMNLINEFKRVKEELTATAVKLEEGLLTGEVKLMGEVLNLTTSVVMAKPPVNITDDSDDDDNKNSTNNTNSSNTTNNTEPPKPVEAKAKDDENKNGVVVIVVVTIMVLLLVLLIFICTCIKDSEGASIFQRLVSKCKGPQRTRESSTKDIELQDDTGNKKETLELSQDEIFKHGKIDNYIHKQLSKKI